jgi:hypothetical protein
MAGRAEPAEQSYMVVVYDRTGFPEDAYGPFTTTQAAREARHRREALRRSGNPEQIVLIAQYHPQPPDPPGAFMVGLTRDCSRSPKVPRRRPPRSSS